MNEEMKEIISFSQEEDVSEGKNKNLRFFEWR